MYLVIDEILQVQIGQWFGELFQVLFLVIEYGQVLWQGWCFGEGYYGQVVIVIGYVVVECLFVIQVLVVQV